MIILALLLQSADPDSRIITDMSHRRHVGDSVVLCEAMAATGDFEKALKGYVARHDLTGPEIQHLAHDCAVQMLSAYRAANKK